MTTTARAVRAVLVTGLAILLGGLPVASAVAAGATASDADDSTQAAGRVVLLLDSSGSMKEPAAGGTSKIDAARTALRQVVDDLPDGVQAGIRVFGARVENRGQPGACTDTQNVVPVGPLDRAALREAVAGYRPYGETPIGNALTGAAQDLGPAQPGVTRTIVLLSDGEPTCAPAPCEVARKLRAQGIDLRINVVGLDVSGKARTALQCVARAGGGRYVDAGSAEDLVSGLVQVSVRGLRLFTLTGDRITGGRSSDHATPVEAGTYVDTALADQQPRYYVVDKPRGGGVAVSALDRPPPAQSNWHSVLRVKLTTPAGEECASSYTQDFQVLGLTPIVSTGTLFNQFRTGMSTEACRQASQLVVSVVNEAGSDDYQLKVSTYPAVDHAGDLPPAVVDSDNGPWAQPVSIPVGGPTTDVVGGVSPVDAAPLQPGTTYADTLRPTEQLVYKVPVHYGEAIHLSARLGTDARDAQLLGMQGPAVGLNVISPLGQRVYNNFPSSAGGSDHDFFNGEEPSTVSAYLPPVRVRNVESFTDDAEASSVDGYAYFVLGMGKDFSSADSQIVAPVQVRAEVVGAPSGTPDFAGRVAQAERPTSSPSPKASGKASGKVTRSQSAQGGGSLPWLLGGLGALLLVAVAALAFGLGRRRGRRV